jgi:hypothetical protein
MKRLWRTLLLGLALFGMICCAMSEGGLTTSPSNEFDGDLVLLDNDAVPVRKIIYEVDVEYDVDDLNEAAAFLQSIMESDEWMDREVRGERVSVFDARIKTERLDLFLGALNGEFEMMTYQKVGTDISLQYQDMSNRVLALQTQLDRLLVLYDSASLSDMIVINREVSEIEIELAQLEGSLNQYDSLVEYSEVHIRFYGDALITKSPFFNRLWTTFVAGWGGVVDVFDGLFMVLAAVVPFAIVFGGPAVFFVVRAKRKRRLKMTPSNEPK